MREAARGFPRTSLYFGSAQPAGLPLQTGDLKRALRELLEEIGVAAR